MSLRTRFILTLGISGVFFLFVITVLIFYQVENAMERQFRYQFQNDLVNRIDNMNRVFDDQTVRLQATAKLPMFRSMRFHELTLNQAALKSDVRQLELYSLDLIRQHPEILKVSYIASNASEIFRVEKSGIKNNLSDRSQDKVINQMLDLNDEQFRITPASIDGQTDVLIWWIPVYTSNERINGVLGFSVDYAHVLDIIESLIIADHESVCITNAMGKVIFSSANDKSCDSRNDDLWYVEEQIHLSGLNWELVFSANPEVFLVDIKNIRSVVFGVIFPLVALLGIAFALIFSNYFVGMLRQLVDAARKMGRGLPIKPLEIQRNDELGELASEMNRSASLIDEARRQLEEKGRDAEAKHRRNLQAILNYSPAVIYLKDLEGRYLFINQKFEELFKIEQKDILGKTDHDVFSSSVADNLRANDETVLRTGEALEVEENVYYGDQTDDRIYGCVKFPLYDEAGKVYAVCGISTDITDRKHGESRLRQAIKMDALGKLTGGIAHDYNNMLGIILGFSELLLTELSDQPKTSKYAQQIYHAGKRGAALTQKLLQFSKHKSSNPECQNINTLLHEQYDMLKKTLTVRVNLKLDLADDLWDVYIDSGDFEDVIVNMSINAMHAMAEGGELTLQTRNERIDQREASLLDIDVGNYVVLNITDTGCGMDANIKDKIFDPFFSSKGDKGTGLGLSQVYGFIESSNGAIKVSSELDKGSCFSLYFPRHVEKSRSDSEIEQIENPLIKTGNQTILVVDDEPALLNLSSKLLTQQGYRVFVANDANEALDILKSHTIDLLFTDVIMPGIDGYQLAEMVMEKYPQVKIQLASGFSDTRHVNVVNQTLHDNMLPKPYEAEDLIKKISEVFA